MSGAAVALVGAGPGDPGLLTLRAEALLGLAATVVVDAGVAALAETFAGGAHVVVVPGAHPAAAALIEAVSRAAGPVVRLYRGDPWLHPAYAPERAGLERLGVAVEAVAGVAVEVAVPALAGVAVHVRHLAVVCTLGRAGALPPATHPWRTLVASGDDPVAVVRSVAAGGDAGLPAALVPLADPASAWRGPLAGAGEVAATVAGPALVVVGAVCGVTSGPRAGVAGPAADARPRSAAGGAGRDPGEPPLGAGHGEGGHRVARVR